MFRYRMDTAATLILLGMALALIVLALELAGGESHGFQADTAPEVRVAYGTRGG